MKHDSNAKRNGIIFALILLIVAALIAVFASEMAKFVALIPGVIALMVLASEDVLNWWNHK